MSPSACTTVTARSSCFGKRWPARNRMRILFVCDRSSDLGGHPLTDGRHEGYMWSCEAMLMRRQTQMRWRRCQWSPSAAEGRLPSTQYSCLMSVLLLKMIGMLTRYTAYGCK
jgi:hypothetical protein